MAAAPLAGIRIADFSWVWAGPFCTLQLAHLGAEVIRIETATRPCPTRMLPPWADNKVGLNRSGYFNQFNQGKRSITLNFGVAEAREVALRLVAKSDVVVNNFAAGVMDRMGFGYQRLCELKPDIIMISLSGYGDTGPYHEYVGYGPALVPLAGFSSTSGYKGGPPGHTGFSYPDPNGGINGAFAVLAALYHRTRTGEGQYIDLSQWEAATTLMAEGVLEYQMNDTPPLRDGNRDPLMAPHGIFRCADLPETIGGVSIDTWVTIACADNAEWRALATEMGQAELADSPRFKSLGQRKANEDELEAIISAWTRPQDAHAVAERLQRAGVPATVASTNKDIVEDPHLNARQFFVELEHPEVGRRKHMGMPWRLSRTHSPVRSPAPLLGQHTDEVLTGLLGYSWAEVDALRAQGALK